MRAEGKPVTLRIKGWQERPEMGISYVEVRDEIDLSEEMSHYTNVSEYGYAVLGTIAKYCNGNDGHVLFSKIVNEVGLEEQDVIETLDKLSDAGVINIHYYRYFDLYNSQFLPSITPTGR